MSTINILGILSQGYFELDTSLSTTISSIRGECQETATAIDKKYFIVSGAYTNIIAMI